MIALSLTQLLDICHPLAHREMHHGRLHELEIPPHKLNGTVSAQPWGKDYPWLNERSLLKVLQTTGEGPNTATMYKLECCTRLSAGLNLSRTYYKENRNCNYSSVQKSARARTEWLRITKGRNATWRITGARGQSIPILRCHCPQLAFVRWSMVYANAIRGRGKNHRFIPASLTLSD